jgi:hypothetical protein
MAQDVRPGEDHRVVRALAGQGVQEPVVPLEQVRPDVKEISMAERRVAPSLWDAAREDLRALLAAEDSNSAWARISTRERAAAKHLAVPVPPQE